MHRQGDLQRMRTFKANQEARAAAAKEVALLERRIALAAQPAQPTEPSPSDENDNGPWSAKSAEMLKQLWLSGHSAAQIADALGGTSRNAVISKARRLGLPFKTPSTGETID
jgi:hypothetical protein